MKQLLLFFLLSIPAVAQKSFLVKDGSTNEPIAYTSILYHIVTKDKWGNITQDFLLKRIDKGSYQLIMCELTLTN